MVWREDGNADEMTEGMDDCDVREGFYCSKEQFAKISSKNVEGGSEEREDDDVYFLPRVQVKQMKAIKDLQERRFISRMMISAFYCPGRHQPKIKRAVKTQTHRIKKEKLCRLSNRVIAISLGNRRWGLWMGRKNEQMAKKYSGQKT